jgi:hypothetical protein
MSGISGKYRLDARLGGGGMAEVFLGSAVGIEGFSRKVAIKRVLPGFSENPAFAQMFVSEAQISSQLVHPNIVSVLDFDRDPEGRLFLVMELVEGRDLDALVATGVLPFPVVIFVISEVLRGLGYAHDLPGGSDVRGVVHRDVSPHNVLLSWEGAVKVSDFGIAKARAASAATASVFIKGKPAYMSPEQANGERLDGRSDLFAVGVMLWEMLAGRRLFVGEDTRATLAAVLFGQIPRPRSLRGDVPKDVERVAMKLLERDLPARYETAELAIQDLLECSDAPKAGRELLVKTLAERYPQAAPVRQSVMRSRGTPVPGVQLSPNQPTMIDGAAGRPAAPSMGAMRAAETVAGTRPRRGRGKMLAVMIPAVIVSGAIAFGIVSAVTSGSGAGTRSAAGTGSAAAAAAGSAAAAPAPAPDAVAVAVAGTGTGSGAPVNVVQATVDAGVADAAMVAAKKDASSIAPAHSGARPGTLNVLAFPILTVIVDKKTMGDTPLTVPLPAGKHVVRLMNAETGHDETVTVTITENQTLTLDRRK